MKTSHLDEMIACNGKVIGAKVQFRDPSRGMTAANHRIAFLAVPGLADDPQKTSHNGMHHTAFEYESFDDLMTSYYGCARAWGLSLPFDHGSYDFCTTRIQRESQSSSRATILATGTNLASG